MILSVVEEGTGGGWRGVEEEREWGVGTGEGGGRGERGWRGGR